MDNYVYIVAGLPELTSGFETTGFDYAALKESVMELLSEKDQQLVELMEEGFDEQTLGPDFYAKAATEGVKANMGNAAFVKELIASVVKAFNPQNASPVALDLILPEKLKAEVEPFVKNEIASQLKAEVKVDYSKKMNGGFKVAPKDGGYVLSFTDEEFTQLIANYLRPATKKILFG